jgi:hypothetical protein
MKMFVAVTRCILNCRFSIGYADLAFLNFPCDGGLTTYLCIFARQFVDIETDKIDEFQYFE